MVTFDHYVRGDRVCCLVAHSYGTSFAAALARARPHNVKTLLLLASGGPTPLMPPPVIRSVPAAFVDACLKPFLRCGFRRQQQYSASSGAASGGKGAAAKDENARGKAMKFQEAFDVPAYVFKHIMAGQTWPEGEGTAQVSKPARTVHSTHSSSNHRRCQLPPSYHLPYSAGVRPEGPLRVPGGDVRDGADHTKVLSGAPPACRPHGHARPAKGTQRYDAKVSRRKINNASHT